MSSFCCIGSVGAQILCPSLSRFRKSGYKIWTCLDPIQQNELIGANLNLVYIREIRSKMGIIENLDNLLDEIFLHRPRKPAKNGIFSAFGSFSREPFIHYRLNVLVKKKFRMFLLWILFVSLIISVTGKNYTADWKSLDARPLPRWYDAAKFGIFAHWGVFSVPAFGSEWFWYNWKNARGKDALVFDTFMNRHYRNGTSYADFAADFTAEDFDANKFAEIISASGARYFVLTTKHHEGFTLWPSSSSWNWNAADVGPHVDLVDLLAQAIRSAGLHFGTYFSLMDWFHPLYLADKSKNTTQFPMAVTWPQIHELVQRYEPDLIWSDGDWEVSDKYWHSEEILAWLYNSSPIKEKIVVNDRWGSGTVGVHGGYLTYSDEFDPGVLMPRKWENCLKMDAQSWGYRRNMKAWDVLTVKELIIRLARTISCGGNLLLNIGPDRTGRIVPIFEERLRQLGQFVRANSEAIFDTHPWIYQNESNNIWYTSRLRKKGAKHFKKLFNEQHEENTIIYAFVVEIPRDSIVHLNFVKPTNRTKVHLLGVKNGMLQFGGLGLCESLVVDLKQVPWQDWPSRDVIVLKIEYAASEKRNPLIENKFRGVSFFTAKNSAYGSRSPYARFARATHASVPSLTENCSDELNENRGKIIDNNTNKNDISIGNENEFNDDTEKKERNYLLTSNFK